MHADGLWWQYAVIALAVMASAVYVFRSRFPASWRRLRVALALPLLRGQRRPWLQRLGHWLAPAPAAASSAACGGCDGCGDADRAD